MVALVSEFVGQGLYTTEEVAFYARQPTQTVNRWLLGNKAGKAVVHRQFSDTTRFVTFLDFIQTLAVAAIRRNYDVPLQTIRDAVDEARDRHKCKYPLAMQHTTYLLDRIDKASRPKEHKFADEECKRRYELFIKLPNDSLVQLTGKHRGNRAIKEIVEVFLSDVSFDESGLATAYRAFAKGTQEIWMNPKKRFGEPLTPSGYTAIALWDAVQVEGSIELAAKAYGVDRTEVELACSYLDFLRIHPPRA